MNKAQLISTVSDKSCLSKKDAEKALTTALDVIIDCITKGEKVKLTGFGSFSARIRNSRQASHPKTGEIIDISPAIVPVFKPAQTFKSSVNEMNLVKGQLNIDAAG